MIPAGTASLAETLIAGFQAILAASRTGSIGRSG